MRDLAPTFVAHGGLQDDELDRAGVRAADVLDVSVNVNPYGPCPDVRRAIFETPLHRYPDPTAAPARRALGAALGVDAPRIIVGSGAVDVLWGLARASLRAGDTVTLVEPTFSEMRAAATRMGARVVEHRTRAEDDFSTDLGALDALLRDARPRLLYLCTPSNPAGVCTSPAELAALARRHRETLMVVDLSFLSLSDRWPDADACRSEQVVWVRSLTKDHALPGLRVGYAVAPPDVAAKVEAERPPWSVSALAQAAAIATTTAVARHFVAESRERLLSDRAHLVDALRRLDLRVHPSEAIYVLVDLGPRRSATLLREALLRRQHVLIRDATSFGLPHHIRIAVRPRDEADRVVAALHREIRP